MSATRRRTLRESFFTLLGLLALACDIRAAGATAADSSAVPRQGLLAQLTRAHETLDARGISISGFAQFDGSHVLSGGVPHPLALDVQRLLDLSVTIDTDKLLGWRGGTLFLDAQSHSGASVIPHQVPAIADPDNMDAYAKTSVDRAWFEQDLFARRVRVQLDLMYVDDRFFTVPFGENFVSLDFSSDASISTFVLPTYPKGAWGVDVFAHPLHSASVSLGVFRDRETELPYQPGGELMISEEAMHGRWYGMPVRLQIGGWIDTGRFERFAGGVKHRAAGTYLVASGTLWRAPGGDHRGIGAFIQYGDAPATVAAVRRHFGGGLVWTGPWSARPRDEFGIAYSDSLLAAHAGFTQRFESEIETYYQIDLPHGWTVQPDLEYWQHPGGRNTPDTVLGLMRIMLNF